jgi:hypothetical protein
MTWQATLGGSDKLDGRKPASAKGLGIRSIQPVSQWIGVGQIGVTDAAIESPTAALRILEHRPRIEERQQ